LEELVKMELLDGKKVRQKMLSELKEQIKKEKVGLAVIQVGEDEASKVYVRQKEKMAEELGFKFEHIKFDESVSEEALLNKIDELNENDLIDGILVQMPIPKHLNASVVQNRINPLKDVDGLTDVNAGCLMHNKDALVPCTPQGIIDLLKYYGIEFSGKNVTIIGRSDLVGKPLASLMINNDATVTLCHSKTKNLSLFTTNADILIVAVGKAKLIKKDYVKEGAIIVDVGINRQEDGKLCGDVDFENIKDKVSYITPVPGGVGQMTVAELAKNTYKAHILRKDNK
jgi:methylenetetrahydrofolate dehydrogenase (NADP+)/methenyltetrahydrofolate cyclohydrolase